MQPGISEEKRREEEEDKFVPSPPTVIFEKAIFFFCQIRVSWEAVWMGAEELQGDTLAVTKSLKSVPRVSPLRHVGSMG